MNPALLNTRKFTAGAGLLANALGQTLQQWASNGVRPTAARSKPAPTGPTTAPGSVDIAA
jgi:hypothetical protein